MSRKIRVKDVPRMTYTGARHYFPVEGQIAIFIHDLISDEVVDGQLDGLLRRHAHQLRYQTSVEAEETLVSNNLSNAGHQLHN